MLQRCAEELVCLKSVWDVVSTILFMFSDWRKTPWDKIDVDVLIDETKVCIIFSLVRNPIASPQGIGQRDQNAEQGCA